MKKYLVTEFTVIEAESQDEAKALVAELEGEVLAVEADAYNNDGRVADFGAFRRVVQEMEAGHVVMTPEDIRAHIENDLQNAKDFDEVTEFEDLDMDELVNRALKTSVWNKGFTNDAIMESAWDIVHEAASQAAMQMKREQ